MFTNVNDAANYLMSRKTKTDLKRFNEILDELHIPYDKIKCIHVTGTNGKGSTINYMRSILNEAGYKVGTFTSPYIVCHQDRFCIDGKMMSDEDFLELVNRYEEAFNHYELSMFEIDVLLAFVYFYEKQVDVALIEVGIGGLNDKTNVISPIASVITNVGNDHLKQLGPTLEDVARNKAGIIKEKTPVFIGEMEKNLETVISQIADEKQAVLTISHPATFIQNAFDYHGIAQIELGNVGSYQIKNASLAIEVILSLFKDITTSQIKTGVKKAMWPGRFEYFNIDGKDVYIDGAHNTHAMPALFDSIEHIKNNRQVHVIYAALRDKNYQEMASMIQNQGYVLHVAQFEDDRAMSKQQALELNAQSFYRSIKEAIEDIKNLEGVVIVCGSLHFISQFRQEILKQ